METEERTSPWWSDSLACMEQLKLNKCNLSKQFEKLFTVLTKNRGVPNGHGMDRTNRERKQGLFIIQGHAIITHEYLNFTFYSVCIFLFHSVRLWGL